MKRVLLIDDERPLVDGLKKALRPWREHWDVSTAVGGRAGIELLQQQTFDAVVSDARMPDVDGEAVLIAARTLNPNAVRLVLSGQVDAKTGHRLASVAHQFLVKPSSPQAVMRAIEECVAACDGLRSDQTRALVRGLGTLPVAPRVYHRITTLIDSPEAPVGEVADIVSEDVAMATSVLRFVSSALFGITREVKDVREAVVLVGLEQLRELVLLSEVFAEPDRFGVLDELQRRGLIRSRLARLMTERSPITHLASEAALLAEVGLYALAWRNPETWLELSRREQAKEAAWETLELEVLGCTTAELGASLLSQWGIPQTVVTAVRFHRECPGEGAELDARTATALASALEREAREGTPDFTDLCAARLGLGGKLPAWRHFLLQQTGLAPAEASP